MEFKEVVGLRRSIRFWQPWHPVEDEKLQAIVAAIHRAPRILEVDFVRTVVLRLDELSHEELTSMKTPTTTAQIDLCPVLLWVFADMEAIHHAGDNLRALIDAGALSESHGWTEERLEATILPEVYERLIKHQVQVPMGYAIAGAPPPPKYSREVLRLARAAIGLAQTYAMLAAVDAGLGTQLSWVTPGAPRKIMKIPPTWLGDNPVFLGYAAESREAGGQRPREPLEDDFHEGRYGRPFRSDPRVVERLKQAKMIREPLPMVERFAELQRLSRMFGLPE
jgi:nitroreductase